MSPPPPHSEFDLTLRPRSGCVMYDGRDEPSGGSCHARVVAASGARPRRHHQGERARGGGLEGV
eukprot:2795476-Pyramimonas_sp.AAC.1